MDSSPGDAAVDSAVPPPAVACTEGALATGAFNFRCSAGPGAVNAGGTIATGIYNLSRAHNGLFCPSAYVIGSAEVFRLSTGELLMRFLVLKKASTTDPGTRVTGTAWLQTVGGRVTYTELCDPGRKGQVKTGSVEANATSFILTFLGGQEEWTK